MRRGESFGISQTLFYLVTIKFENLSFKVGRINLDFFFFNKKVDFQTLEIIRKSICDSLLDFELWCFDKCQDYAATLNTLWSKFMYKSRILCLLRPLSTFWGNLAKRLKNFWPSSMSFCTHDNLPFCLSNEHRFNNVAFSAQKKKKKKKQERIDSSITHVIRLNDFK